MKLSRASRTVLFLLIYLVVIAIYSFPNYQQSGAWGEFFSIIGGSLALFALLWYVLNRRDKFRQNNKNDAIQRQSEQKIK